MTPRAPRGLGLVLTAAAVIAALAILRPWTIVPIQSTPQGAFDPEAYVDSIWTSRVLPAARETAVELDGYLRQPPSSARAGGGAATRAVFVKGRATITEVDRGSRVGLARLRVTGGADAPAVAIQIGPVLRGTALRDALPFVRFTDFVNQLEFAAVANALNDRVLAEVIDGVEVDGLAGREVEFVGASPARSGAVVEIVPVLLGISGGAS